MREDTIEKLRQYFKAYLDNDASVKGAAADLGIRAQEFSQFKYSNRKAWKELEEDHKSAVKEGRKANILDYLQKKQEEEKEKLVLKSVHEVDQPREEKSEKMLKFNAGQITLHKENKAKEDIEGEDEVDMSTQDENTIAMLHEKLENSRKLAKDVMKDYSNTRDELDRVKAQLDAVRKELDKKKDYEQAEDEALAEFELPSVAQFYARMMKISVDEAEKMFETSAYTAAFAYALSDENFRAIYNALHPLD